VVLILGVPLHLLDLLKARLSRHELKYTVHAEHRTSFRLDSRGLESIPDLEASVFEDKRLLHIEEARSFTDLLEVGATESLLDDDVQQLALDTLSLVNSCRFTETDLTHGSLINLDVLGLALEYGLKR
jgi:hypothetical protein